MPMPIVLPFCNPLNSSVDKRNGVERGLAMLYALGFVSDGPASLARIVNQKGLEGIRCCGGHILSEDRMALFPEFGLSLRQDVFNDER